LNLIIFNLYYLIHIKMNLSQNKILVLIITLNPPNNWKYFYLFIKYFLNLKVCKILTKNYFFNFNFSDKNKRNLKKIIQINKIFILNKSQKYLYSKLIYNIRFKRNYLDIINVPDSNNTLIYWFIEEFYFYKIAFKNTWHLLFWDCILKKNIIKYIF
jgi:hypothetical protein